MMTIMVNLMEMNIIKYYLFYCYMDVLVSSISLFFVLFLIIHCTKPSFLYKNNGSLRKFGIGKKNKTVIHWWMISIVIAILSYQIILLI